MFLNIPRPAVRAGPIPKSSAILCSSNLASIPGYLNKAFISEANTSVLLYIV